MVRRMKEGTSQKYVYMKQRITKAQGKAKTIGFLYLFAILAIFAFIYAPIALAIAGANGNADLLKWAENLLPISVSGSDMGLLSILGGITADIAIIVMCITLLVNVIRALCKLGWLYKRKASRVYGFNRNVYAMDDLGKIFSSSFATAVSAYLLLACVMAEVAVSLCGWIFLAVGLLIHFVCGLAGGNVSVFDIENGVVEQKREVGRVSVVVRNVLQLAASVALMYFVLTTHMLRVHFAAFDDVIYEIESVQALLDNPMQLMPLLLPVIEIVGVLFVLGMLRYALGTTEFDIEGKETAGRKKFMLLSFLALVCFGGSLAYTYLIAKTELPQATLIITAIAAAAFLLEIILCAFPKVKRDKEEKAAAQANGQPGNPYKPASEEVDVKTFLMEACKEPGVYDMPYGYNNAAFASAQGMYQPPVRR